MYQDTSETKKRAINIILMFGFIAINMMSFQIINAQLYANLMSEVLIYLIVVIALFLVYPLIYRLSKWQTAVGILVIATLVFWSIVGFSKPVLTYKESIDLVATKNESLVILNSGMTDDPHYSEMGFKTQPALENYNPFLKKDYVVYGYFSGEETLYHFIVNPKTKEISRVTMPK